MNPSLIERLNTLPDAPAESWKPKPGDVIEGTLVEYQQADTAYGLTWIAHVQVDATAHHGAYVAAVWLSHKVLREAFAKQRPRPGERLGIRRLSDAADADGKTKYARYVLIVDRPGENPAGPNWDALAGEEQHDSRTGAEDDVPF